MQYFSALLSARAFGDDALPATRGKQALETLLQETLAAAHRAGALSLRATETLAVDTTVREKAIAHPTEHGLPRTAIEQLGGQAQKAGLRLRRIEMSSICRPIHDWQHTILSNVSGSSE